ncbi:hypothetical protein BV392_07200 [Rhodovulum sulfidophilum]|nr:hypothetical protein BV392_07200 [Rhodovulum sulfidophilum]
MNIVPEYMRSYGAGRTVCRVLEGLSWITIIVGVLVSIGGLLLVSSNGGYSSYRSNTNVLQFLFAMAPGIGVALAGGVMLMFSQVTAAIFDISEMTRESLVASGLLPKDVIAATEQDLRSEGSLVKNYRGKSITKDSTGFAVDGRHFNSIGEAQAFIDGNR